MNQLSKKIIKVGDEMIFAGVKALTRVAVLAQKQIREELPQKFTIRNTWTIKGIRITPATKKNQTSEVWSKDWYMPGHEYGQDRKSKSNYFLIPVNIRSALGLSDKKTIPVKYRMPNLLNQTVAQEKPFTRNKGIYISPQEGKTSMLYYFYPKKVNIKKHEWFVQTVSKIYDENLEKEYQKALAESVIENI